jgi:hypothetical protein
MMLPKWRVAAATCLRALSVVGLALLACSCAGSGEGLDENGRPIGENPQSPPPDGAVDFAFLQSAIFTPLCTTCHAGGAAPLGLRLEPGVSYAMLVTVASVEVPELARVSPGNPDASYLVHKIEGRAAVGARMPLGGPPLPQTSIDNVRQWIGAGAAAPAASSVDAAPTEIVASAPIDGEALDAPLSRLLVVASRPLDASLVNATTVLLRRVGAATQYAPATAPLVPLRNIRVPLNDPSSVWIETAMPLGAGDYELQLRASGAAALADMAGEPLDGDGNGAAGGDYHLTFTLTEPPR